MVQNYLGGNADIEISYVHMYVYGSLVEGGLKESNIKKVNALVQLFWQIDGFGSNALLKKCESSILKMIT